jgi:hypothetical protein
LGSFIGYGNGRRACPNGSGRSRKTTEAWNRLFLGVRRLFCYRRNSPNFIEGEHHEISAPAISPSRSGRCRKAQLAELGAEVLAGSPADFGKLIAQETEKWGKVVKFAGIKAD